MKRWIFGFLFLSATLAGAQQLQLHYDIRHTLDPRLHARNYPTLIFEYFKDRDSLGSFLLKAQADFTGHRHSPGQVFFQVSKNLRYWKPKVFLTVHYSGGLGVAQPSFGYYISNSFGVGVAKNLFWKNTVLSFGLLYRYNAFARGSHDGQLNFFFFRGFLNYRLQASGSFVSWTQNRDIGIDQTKNLQGKKIAFFGDPQLWWKIMKHTAIGTRINLYYRVITDQNRVQVYPSGGVRWEL